MPDALKPDSSDAPSSAPAAGPGIPTSIPRLYLTVEGVLLFGGIPSVLFAIRDALSHLVIPILLVLGLLCSVVLWKDVQFERSQLWNDIPTGRPFRRVLLRFVLLGTGVTGILGWVAPELLLSFPRQRPVIWAALMIAYPLLSVYPQEIIFRAFLFHRYRSLLPSPALQVAGSAFAFGWAHVLFGNWTAPLLSLAGGFLFATTYARTGSLRLVAVEHALWGGFVFTVGLGRYFYSAAIG